MDVIRIFKTALSFFLVVIFLLLLVSAYSHHRTVLSTSSLIEASSTISNTLVLQELIYTRGARKFSYVIDPSKISSLTWEVSLSGENFQYNLNLVYWKSGKKVELRAGPPEPSAGQISAIALPVAIFDNFRFEAGILEVKVWRK